MLRALRWFVSWLFALAIASPAWSTGVPPTPYLTYTTAASGIDQAVAMAHAGDGSARLFVAERAGRIRIVKPEGLVATPFLDIHAQVALGGDAGLLGVAFDPAYSSSHRFFVSYVRASDGALRVSSFIASANPDVADAASETEVITIPHAASSARYGGFIAFAPDGTLFVSTGDGGTDGTPAQDLASLLGKLLRLDVSASPGYAIPPNNYYAATSDPVARHEIAARGLRDPRYFSFDRATGDLYLSDFGATMGEIDTLPSDWWRSNAVDFGWPHWEGTRCLDLPALKTFCSPLGVNMPQSTRAVNLTGGYVYRGLKSAQLQGFYLYGSRNFQVLMGAVHEGATWYDLNFGFSQPAGSTLVAFGEDETGELYYVTDGGVVVAVHGPPPAVPPSTTVAYQPNRHVDYDGDGKGDVTLWSVPAMSVFEYGTWLMEPPSIKASAPIPTGDTSWRLWDVGDYDANARTDRLWRDASGSYWIELVNGTAATSPVRVLAGGSGWEAVGHGDFNGDGKMDLVWRNGRMAGLWLLDGTSIASYGVLDDPDPAYFYHDARPLLTGDFNGDGKSDILWYRDSDASVALSLMDAMTTTWKGTIHPGPTYWVPDMTADFNGDGKSDILWRCADGAYGIWLMNGSTYSTYAVIRPGGTDARVLYARDFDGDGKADLVWQNGDGSYEGWLMDGLAVKTVVPLNAGPDWYIAAADDYDGDGKTDLLWLNTANPSTGTILTTSIAPPNYTLIAAPPAGWGPWQ